MPVPLSPSTAPSLAGASPTGLDTAPSPPPGGHVCAGLRWTLLAGWRDGFPITRSPYQEIARRAGGSLRELLGHGRALVADGVLDGVAPRWGHTLHRTVWRMAVGTAGTDDAEVLADAVAALPGVVAIDRPDTPVDRGPVLWFTLVARHDDAARAQLASLAVGAVRPWATRAGPTSTTCPPGATADSCPCRDPRLAAGLEARLPVTAHPYAGLADRLDRPERDVLARLRAWRRDGRLDDLGLQAPPQPRRIPCRLLGAQGAAPSAEAWARVIAMPGVIDGWCRDDGWQLVVTGVPDGPAAPLARALRSLGPAAAGARAQVACRTVVRDGPLLFADGTGAAQALDATPATDRPHASENTGPGDTPIDRPPGASARSGTGRRRHDPAPGLQALRRQLGW